MKKYAKILQNQLPFVILGVLALVPTQGFAEPTPKEQKLLQKAIHWEKTSRWDKACVLYKKLLHQNTKSKFYRGKYFHCLRRYLQVVRHKDPSYRKDVLSLNYGKSLRLYTFLMTFLQNHALEQDKVTPLQLFQKGLQELDYALSDANFRKLHLKYATLKEIKEFRTKIRTTWNTRSVYSVEQAANEIREISIEAIKKLKLRPTTVVMEFTCGGCYAFDNYTKYLTPDELRRLCNSLKGETVGVGLKVGLRGGRIVITHIDIDGPAAEVEPSLMIGDEISNINGKSTELMSPETVTGILNGTVGSKVRITVAYPEMSQSIELIRRPIFQPSVEFEMKTASIGYLAVHSFQETTLIELDSALSTLKKQGAKALVLDLRGNRGGIVEAAIEASRRFLRKGVIVSTKTSDAKFDVTYVSNNPTALALPLVVLVNGETASSAEILAGALKDNNRALFVGQPTFGKSCIQEVYEISPHPGLHYPGGLRITVARFYSPNGKAYTGNSIVPDLLVEDSSGYSSLVPNDPQLEQALLEAQKKLDDPM